ncbi:MAG: hypothetical protein L6R40_008609 [Gallowayella cf. fulva]|nr:MAG: hypothetical protein L6R40_008609 [Xanthomendoza cf. fulva]
MAPRKYGHATVHTLEHSPEYYRQMEGDLNVLEFTQRVYGRGSENLLSLVKNFWYRYCQFTKKNPVATLEGISINVLYAFFDWLLRERKGSLGAASSLQTLLHCPTTPPSRFRNKYFEVPRNPSSVFTGREEICEQLHACCSPSGKTNIQRQQKRFVIHGLGGSGKTQVCLKFAEDHREEFWGIFWMDASSAESLEQGYLQVAEVCGLEARVSVVQRWLSNTSEPWALILDNADDPRLDISRYFPVGNRGVVLITTRNRHCEFHSTVGSCELGAMATDEAVTLLLRTAGADNISDQSIRDAAESVVQTLGCLALAITQAGAVIRQGYCKMEEYRTLYSKHRKELLSQKAIQGGEDYRYTVYTTWEVSRQMIEEMSTETGQDALALLRMFSFLHYEGISEEIFNRVWRGLHKNRQSGWMISHQLKMLLRQSDQEWNVYPLRAAISILRSFSLIDCDKNELISVHPLVHSWTRDQMSASDEDAMWRQTTATIALSIPWTFETADYRFRQSMMPHIDACLGFRKEGVFSLRSVGEDCQIMASNFALVYSEVGRRQEALQLTERVVEAKKRTLGEEHPDTLTSIHTLVYMKTPQNTTNSYRQPSNSENELRIQHPNGRKTKRYPHLLDMDSIIFYQTPSKPSGKRSIPTAYTPYKETFLMAQENQDSILLPSDPFDLACKRGPDVAASYGMVD